MLPSHATDSPTPSVPQDAKPCKHGHVSYCEPCRAEHEPKCPHGHPYYCGFCGPWTAWPKH